MGWANSYIDKLLKGEEVEFRPRGNSMEPKIKSGQLVKVSPDISSVGPGSVVLCKVGFKQYLHYCQGISRKKNKFTGDIVIKYKIENAKGRFNGWTQDVYGKVIKIYNE